MASSTFPKAAVASELLMMVVQLRVEEAHSVPPALCYLLEKGCTTRGLGIACALPASFVQPTTCFISTLSNECNLHYH